MGVFERGLTLWIGLALLLGLGLGQLAPSFFLPLVNWNTQMLT